MKNIAVLFGGPSAEHEISLLSARSIIQNLDQSKYNPVPVFIDKNKIWHLVDLGEFKNNNANKILFSNVLLCGDGQITSLKNFDGKYNIKIDIVFPVLHGPYGEDGIIQGLLKSVGVPFVGSSVSASAIGMDKLLTKQLLSANNIPVVPYVVLRKEQFDVSDNTDIANISYPVFVKPANMGSSIGVSRVESEDQLIPAIQKAFLYDHKILIEKAIVGREIECAILNGDKIKPSVLGEIIPRHDFYSYEAKYIDPEGAQLIIPAPVDETVSEKIRGIAVEVFRVLDCRGLARVDFFLKDDGTIYVNEINTMPGFTSISMYPKLFEYMGISYSDLLDRLIEIAFKDHAEDNKLLLDYHV